MRGKHDESYTVVTLSRGPLVSQILSLSIYELYTHAAMRVCILVIVSIISLEGASS